MEYKNSYCTFSLNQEKDNVNYIYHNHHYGFPIESDDELFGRLLLEINQAGLSWETILKKENGFRTAYDNFNIKKIGAYTETDRSRLLSNPAIIRNKLKVNASIHNANVILQLQTEFGTFKKWLDHHHPKTKEQWVKLFKKHFKFTGGEITNEFLMSSGYLPGAHSDDCPIHKIIVTKKPMWITHGIAK